MPNNVYNAVVSSHDKIHALPKYITISIRSTHLFLFHCFFSSSFSPVGEMTVSFLFSFCTRRLACSFLFPVPPMHLVFLILLKCIGCFGSHIISFFFYKVQ